MGIVLQLIFLLRSLIVLGAHSTAADRSEMKSFWRLKAATVALENVVSTLAKIKFRKNCYEWDCHDVTLKNFRNIFRRFHSDLRRCYGA